MKKRIILGLLLPTIFCSLTVFAQERLAVSKNQCEKFADADFLGTEISINVVDVDIRDVLHYFYEQFGCDSRFDSLVGNVLITAKVENTPWNVALKNILQSRNLDAMVKKTSSSETNEKTSLIFIATKEKIRREIEWWRNCYSRSPGEKEDN